MLVDPLIGNSRLVSVEKNIVHLIISYRAYWHKKITRRRSGLSIYRIYISYIVFYSQFEADAFYIIIIYVNTKDNRCHTLF